MREKNYTCRNASQPIQIWLSADLACVNLHLSHRRWIYFHNIEVPCISIVFAAGSGTRNVPPSRRNAVFRLTIGSALRQHKLESRSFAKGKLIRGCTVSCTILAEQGLANSNKDSSHPKKSLIPNNKMLESGTCQNAYFPIFLACNLERLPKLQ